MARRRRNDPALYDDLRDQWWRPQGSFAALHWLAAARAQHIPAPNGKALLIDIACGGGLMAPHVRGYRHVGIDLVASALQQARDHGAEVVQADAGALPLPDSCADVVVAGEVFEHVTDLEAVVAESARILRPGGLLVCDTINDTRWARWALVTVGERVPGGPPAGIHDPALFVSPYHLRALYAEHAVDLRVRGLRPAAGQLLRFAAGRRNAVSLVPTRSVAILYEGVGVKVGG